MGVNKIKLTILLMLMINSLGGCGMFSADVDSMNMWSFQYNEGTEDYSLFFGLSDKNEKHVSAPCSVNIRIENNDGNIVYEDTKKVERRDFGIYTNKKKGEQYLADVRIDADEIEEGSSGAGTVYFTVTGKNFKFDEVNCEVISGLPLKSILISTEGLPITVHQKDWNGSIKSELQITDMDYKVEDNLENARVSFVLSGEKISGESSGYDIIDYKLCDDEGYVVDAGHLFIGNSLAPGDKFRDDSLVIYDVPVGKNYTMKFIDSEF